MAIVKYHKVTSLPATCEANAIYFVETLNNGVEVYITDTTGNPLPVNSVEDVVNVINGKNGNVQLELSLTGGLLSISGGNTSINLDLRYFKTTDDLPWGQIKNVPIATTSDLGLIKVGNNLSVDVNGVLSAAPGMQWTDAQW